MNELIMKHLLLLLAIIVAATVISNAQKPAKQVQVPASIDSTGIGEKPDSTSFAVQYAKQKADYMNELKKDSFLLTVPAISNNLYEGQIEVAPGITKRHVTKIVIGMQSQWQYPKFTNEGFEKWLKDKEKQPNKKE